MFEQAGGESRQGTTAPSGSPAEAQDQPTGRGRGPRPVFAARDWEIVPQDPPGPDALAALEQINPAGLSPMAQEALMLAWSAQAGHAAAGLFRTISRYAHDHRGWNTELTASVSCLLTISETAANTKIYTAMVLTDTLTATLHALDTGLIDTRHAEILTDELGHLPHDLATRLETALLPHAQDETPARFRRRTQAAVLTADPDRAAADTHASRADRGVWSRPLTGGMAQIQALLGAEDATRIMDALTAAADADTGGPEDCRTHTARRADALLHWANQHLTGTTSSTPDTSAGSEPTPPKSTDPTTPGSPGPSGESGQTGKTTQTRPRAGGGRPRLLDRVGLLIDLPTLFGLRQHPAHLAGHGPIPADLARHLATDTHWQRMITDPVTGYLLDYGRTLYRPPTDLTRYILNRDQTCRFPHCHQPAWRCDLDHRNPHHCGADGGTTGSNQIIPLCRHHHRLKHHGHWKITGDPNTTITWTTPTGRTYTTTPAQLDPGLLTAFEHPTTSTDPPPY